MQKFVISWIDWFNYEMHMEMCNCGGEMDAHMVALRKCIGIKDDNEWEQYQSDFEFKSVEEIKQEAFNCDGMIGAIRID